MLVTGCAGFIGSHLCERLLRDGYRVWGIDNLDGFYEPSRKRANLAKALRNPAMHFVEGTIQDEILLNGLMSDVRFDAVVHLAAVPSVQASLENPELCYEVNVMGTLRLLEAMRRHSISVLLLGSSASVYDGVTDIVSTDGAPVDQPASPYSASKRSAEILCHTHWQLYGLSVYCLRLFTAYGPRQRPDQEIHTLARLMSTGQPLPVVGEGTCRRDCIYVEDVVDGICRALERARGDAEDDPTFEIVNLGPGERTSRRKLVETLASLLDANPAFDHVPAQVAEVSAPHASVDRARQLLGWEPSTPLQSGLASFVEWFKQVSPRAAPAPPATVQEPRTT